MFKAFEILMKIYVVFLIILGVLMHLWTVYIAFAISGVFWAIVSFFFPVASQLFWGFRAWSVGSFDTPFIQWLILLAIMWVAYYIVLAIIAALAASYEKKKKYQG
jgi:hypothetical protein